MDTGSIYALILALVMSSISEITAKPSNPRFIFMSPESDPFVDSYMKTISRMSTKEIMNLPKLSDVEFLDQLERGYDFIPVSTKSLNSINLFDSTIDEPIEYQPDLENEWEDLMDAGPASINLLGSVMAIASRKDFPLKTDFNYTLVKYPESFQATLMQVSHDMYRALYGAHTSMESIQVSMRQIPTLLKTAIKLITQASTVLNKALLPRTLASIGRYANESAAVARASLERFEYLQVLLHEVLEVTTLTNSDNKETAEKLAAEAEDIRKEKKEMDNVIADITAQYETARKNLEKTRQDYHNAMKNVPGDGWDSHAWNVYASQRPAETCKRNWYGRRRCRSLRDQQFADYSAEAQQKAQQALNILKEAEKNSKNIYNQQMNKQNELESVINNLTTINLHELSINETIKILLDATKNIALLQGQWSRLSRFFSTLTINTEHTQKVILQDFLGVISDAELIGKPLDPIDETLFLVLLVESVTDIDRDSHLLFLMAKTYSDVSNAYMIEQIAELSGVLSLQNDDDRETYLKEVANKSRKISMQVKDLATDRQREYELVNFSRQEQYMKYIEEGMLQEELNILSNIEIGRR
ncbi:unnamed protein product [Rotaria sp. Silwood1]|nr:unnamed protein product [Rotaria sp. Silwood1]CAF0959306.1 unnamed protein product [Rotaria sp. Silwood1]CAF4751240.1 unnamed protein product [Rotaria sp. Silwood1]